MLVKESHKIDDIDYYGVICDIIGLNILMRTWHIYSNLIDGIKAVDKFQYIENDLFVLVCLNIRVYYLIDPMKHAN